MKSNELFEQIHCGLIKENTKIEVIKNGNVISKIKYINGGLRWKEGTFSTQSLCDIDTDFEIVEEEKKYSAIEMKQERKLDNINKTYERT